MMVTFRYRLWIIVVIIFCSCNGIDEDPTDPNSIISIQAKNSLQQLITSIQGDGETVITIEATISEDADTKFREVTFTTSNGSFVASGQKSTKKRVNNLGVVSIDLKLPFSDEDLYITATIGSGDEIFMAEKSINLLKVESVINLEVLDLNGQPLSEELRADMITQLILKGSILKNKEVFKSIMFTTSDGMFSNQKKSILVESNSNSVATTNLTIPQTVGTIIISAQIIDNVRYNDELKQSLKRTHADMLNIEPQKLKIGLDESVEVSVFLSRRTGKVSLNTAVYFKALQLSNNKEVGRFTGIQNARSDLNGLVKVNFHSDTGDFNANGEIRIEAATLNDNLDTIRESIDLLIQN